MEVHVWLRTRIPENMVQFRCYYFLPVFWHKVTNFSQDQITCLSMCIKEKNSKDWRHYKSIFQLKRWGCSEIIILVSDAHGHAWFLHFQLILAKVTLFFRLRYQTKNISNCSSTLTQNNYTFICNERDISHFYVVSAQSEILTWATVVHQSTWS